MHRYTAYYCEENIWHLCQEARFEGMERCVVFVSNPSRSCALWHQRAAPVPAGPVVWDYHVILVVKPGGGRGAQVWDLDTLLGAPAELAHYAEQTFGPARHLPSMYQARFGIVRAERFAQIFSSDRAHMRDPSGRWSQPPPEWPTIGAFENNLMGFVAMSPDLVEEVLDVASFVRRFGP